MVTIANCHKKATGYPRFTESGRNAYFARGEISS